MAADNDWKGVPISHIIGSQSPWGAPEFPLVQPGFNHAVLYHIPANGAQLDSPPKPQIGKEKWDQEHVRMPFSTQSLYPVPNVSTIFLILTSRRPQLPFELFYNHKRNCIKICFIVYRSERTYRDRQWEATLFYVLCSDWHL